MRHGSLFSGIGGFDLASSWMGWKNVWQVEKDKYCRKVLEKNFPESERFEDVREAGKHNLRKVDIITGGFPCQPFSVSGKRNGAEDDRYLWPEMYRIIREMHPRWVLAENVPGILSIENGMVFETVVSDLESEGYEVQPIILSSAGIGANHVRERVWFLARANNTNGFTSPIRKFDRTPGEETKTKKTFETRRIFSDIDWRKWEIEPCFFGKNDGVSRRMDRIKALGNAVDPRLVFRIYSAIEIINNM